MPELPGGALYFTPINTAATYNNQFPADMAHVTAWKQPTSAPVVVSLRLRRRSHSALGGFMKRGESPYVSALWKYFRENVQNTQTLHLIRSATAKHFLLIQIQVCWDVEPRMFRQALYEFHIPSFKWH